MEQMIEFQQVGFTYESPEELEEGQAPGKEVLREVDLRISKGEFVAVLGHNGSGKSTLAKLTNAILSPTQGKVVVRGMDTAQEENRLPIRQTVGMVFQNPDNQIVASIVEEDVAFGPENLGLPREELRRRVDEALEIVGMSDYRRQEPHKLSGGQKQRVAIAGVIAMRPQCIVLDEPTAMLDPSGRREVMKTIRRLNREEGITVLLITHYMDEAVQADRVVVMDDGRILLDDSPKAVFSQVEQLKAVGLDVPQPTELAHDLIAGGMQLKDGILTVEECVQALEELWEEK